MRWIALVTVFGVWLGPVELCHLSADQPNSWVVSIRRFNDQRIECVGTLIAVNYVIAPMTCFQEGLGKGFHKGSEYLASAGEHKYGSCRQTRKGLLVMGHPEMAEDIHTYNIAYLETEPFDLNPMRPPAPPLPRSEKFNVKFLTTLASESAKCKLLWYNSHNWEEGIRNHLQEIEVTMMSRSRCWDIYCPSGNRGCVPYFWSSETFVCASASKNENRTGQKCTSANVGAPLVCNGTTVGVLMSCRWGRPLMVQGYNKHQLKGIGLYRKIASGKVEVEPNGVEQAEPEFPKEKDNFGDILWRSG